jgi:hypothetical protein
MKKILMISLASSLIVSGNIVAAPSAFAQGHRHHHDACMTDEQKTGTLIILATVLGAATGGIASGVAYGAAYVAGGTAIGAGGGLTLGLLHDGHHPHEC